MKTLIYRDSAGKWYAENVNGNRIGGPFDSEEEAVSAARNYDLIMTAVQVSRETTYRQLGCYYDPTD